jgi:hypothetical protein
MPAHKCGLLLSENGSNKEYDIELTFDPGTRTRAEQLGCEKKANG